MNWEVNGCYTPLLVVIAHQGPVSSSVVDVDLSLNVEYSGDAGFLHILSVLLNLRIRADKNVCAAYFFKGQSANEIGIYHFDMPINNECFLHVSPYI